MCIGIEEPEINGLEGESPSFFGITLSQQFLSFFIRRTTALAVGVAIGVDPFLASVQMLADVTVIFLGQIDIAIRTAFSPILENNRLAHGGCMPSLRYKQ